MADQGVPNLVSTLIKNATSALPLWRQKQTIHAIRGISGDIPAGQSTLILGAPGSGKSALLRLLSGRLSPDAGAGTLTFNGESAASLAAHGVSLRKLVAYAPQSDAHEPLFTVRETLEFVHRGATQRPSRGATPDVVAAYDGKVDAVIDVLGLKECEHTVVGNEMLRGISGGQRKRVTVGEAILSGSRVLALDEVTNGLDASTAQSLMEWLTAWAHGTGGTVVAALQAPTPEIVAAFDNVILLAAGEVLFHGPTGGLKPYLATIGFTQPERVDLADFCIELATSPATTAALYGGVVAPLSVHVPNLAAHWKQTAGKQKEEGEGAAAGALSTAINASAAARAQYRASGHANGALMLFALLLSRQWKLTMRNKVGRGWRLDWRCIPSRALLLPRNRFVLLAGFDFRG